MMPYRILCNGVKREDVKASPDLVSELFCFVPLHKIRYGIERAYHIADSPFKSGVIFPTDARAASISAASACPGSKRRADGDRTGDARGARCLDWSRLGSM